MSKQQLPNVANDRRPMLTVTEVAAYLQVPEATVYRWNTRGTGPRPWKVGRHVRYRWDDIDAWVENGNRPHRVI